MGRWEDRVCLLRGSLGRSQTHCPGSGLQTVSTRVWLRPPCLWCLFCSQAEQARAHLTAQLLKAPPWLPGLETAPGSPPMTLCGHCLCPFLCKVMLPCPLFLSVRCGKSRDASVLWARRGHRCSPARARVPPGLGHSCWLRFKPRLYPLHRREGGPFEQGCV